MAEKEMNKVKFAFEELEVWHESIDFVRLIIALTETINSERKHYRLIEQLEASASSIALNIAEGKGRYSRKEFIQYLFIARGSLYETITLLTIFYKNNWITRQQLEDLKIKGDVIGKMISKLINYIRSTLSKSP